MNNIYSKPPSGGFFVVIKRDIEIKRKSMNHRFSLFLYGKPFYAFRCRRGLLLYF